MRQLPLPFDEPACFSAEDFFATSGTALAEHWLSEPEHWTNGRLVLWGDAGCGKTHLLHVWAASHGAVMLHGTGVRDVPATPCTRPVAIDDADLVTDEPALFHILNGAAAAGQPVLMTARLPPARQSTNLPDLASRLKASLAVEVKAPNDAELAALLGRLAAGRQMVLEFHIQNLLLTHLPRTPAALIEAIARIDRAALANGQKITRNLVLDLVKDLTRRDD